MGVLIDGEPLSLEEGVAKLRREKRWFEMGLLRLVQFYDEPGRRKEIHVTDLVGPCLRKAYYSKKAEAYETLGAMMARVRGSVFHEKLEALLKDEPGFQCEPAFEGTLDGQPIRFRLDAITPDGEIMDYKFQAQVKKNDAPKPEHQEQLNLYNALADLQAPALNVGYVSMAGPERCDRCQKPLTQDAQGVACDGCGRSYPDKHTGVLPTRFRPKEKKEVLEKATEKYRILARALETETPPSRVKGFPSHWACRWCGYFRTCQDQPRLPCPPPAAPGRR